MNGWIVFAITFWLAAWAANILLARQPGTLARLAIPALFGIALLVLWEGIVRGLNVPQVILPAPTQIWTALIANVPTLWVDFVQTVLRSVLPFMVPLLVGLLVITAFPQITLWLPNLVFGKLPG